MQYPNNVVAAGRFVLMSGGGEGAKAAESRVVATAALGIASGIDAAPGTLHVILEMLLDETYVLETSGNGAGGTIEDITFEEDPVTTLEVKYGGTEFGFLVTGPYETAPIPIGRGIAP
jgi:hypothetical protein